MRLQRSKVGVDNFEKLIVIDKCAFGEVRVSHAKGTGDVLAMKKSKK
ncbi:hypothetical protein AAHE18_06G170800 [Arachis hypogaea]